MTDTIMRKNAYKKRIMDEKWFAQIKKLIELNLKNKQIAEILKVSSGTICAVKRNPSFEAYKIDQKQREQKREFNYVAPVSKGNLETASSKIQTPMYDVLVEIRDNIAETNRLIAQCGKSKGFRLF
jgi:hypothetical protein